MIDIRHEEYRDFGTDVPFSLGIDLERTPFNCSKEQNWHENVELQLCIQGQGTVLLDGERYDIYPGDIVAINSNAVHYTTTEAYLKYTCLIVSTAWCRRMDIDYTSLNLCPIVKSPAMAELINSLVEMYLNKEDLLRIAKLNEILLKIMIELTEHHSSLQTKEKAKSKKFETIKSAVIFIEKNYGRKIALSEIAENVFMDKYTLCKEFKKCTGQTVTEYLHRHRCTKAIEYLSQGYSVSESAGLCGFENLSFFTKIFKRCTGRNPSLYKR